MDFFSFSQALLVQGMPDRKIASLLGELSERFTSRREAMSGYTENPELVSAYALFYGLTNAPKLTFLLDQLCDEEKERWRTSRFIDWGAGPGTYSLALLNYFGERFEGQVYLVDSSKLMLEQARKLLDHHFPKIQAHYFSPQEMRRVEGESILFFGNSLNEMGIERGLALSDKLECESVALIEPGTSTMFEEILRFRKGMAGRGFQSLYPCANLSMLCPFQLREDANATGWCHQVLRGSHEHAVERLSQLAGLDRKIMPFIGHIYRRQPQPPKRLGRASFVRFLAKDKHSFSWEVCLEQEGKLLLIKLQWQRKQFSKEEEKAMEKISVGKLFDFEIIKELGPLYYRAEFKTNDFGGAVP
jgi:SAM-dependent methyltransferase